MTIIMQVNVCDQKSPSCQGKREKLLVAADHAHSTQSDTS